MIDLFLLTNIVYEYAMFCRQDVAEQNHVALPEQKNDFFNHQHIYIYNWCKITDSFDDSPCNSVHSENDKGGKKLKKVMPISGKLQFSHSTTIRTCLLYTSPSPRDRQKSRMPSSA